MTRNEILDTAKRLINVDRKKQHGDAQENLKNISRYWSDYLSPVTISTRQVAIMMSLLKIARTQTGSRNPDDIIDAVGYLALSEEME